MNGNRSSCPDDKAEAVARFIHAVKNMTKNEFELKYINESGDPKVDDSSNDVKKYIEDWASYDDCINDFISAIESLCGNNAAVTALLCSVMTYSKKQGQLEAKLEKLGISADNILETYCKLFEK
jgi:hypothetical protein|nr:MAG TPA: hypothetical protein [Caudoviricetes sp.]